MTAILGQFKDTDQWGGVVLLPNSPDINVTAEFRNLKIPSYPAVLVDTDPFPVGETILRSGGGLLSLTVDSHYELRNAGEAEAFGHSMLTILGQSGRGHLDINEQRWSPAIFERGTCKIIRAANSSLLIYSLTFLMSSSTVENLVTPNPVPGPPPAFNGRNSNGVYDYGNTTLGSHAHIESIEVSRSPLIKNIPRSTGVRLKSRRGVRSVKITVKSWERAEQSVVDVILPRRKLEYNIYNAIWNVVDNANFIPKDSTGLAGQGNTFENCVLDNYSPSLGDNWWTGPSTLIFTQELDPPS